MPSLPQAKNPVQRRSERVDKEGLYPNQVGAPGEAGGEGLSKEKLARFDMAFPDGPIQGQGDGGGRSVGVAIDGEDGLLPGHLETLSDRVNDAQVGLMGDEPVNGGGFCVRDLQDLVYGLA